jgi:hypothetical protein
MITELVRVDKARVVYLCAGVNSRAITHRCPLETNLFLVLECWYKVYDWECLCYHSV